MNIVIFCHPAFLQSQSMPRFANMLKAAYEQRGHKVTMWSPHACAYNLVPRGMLSKWAGYIDQYILFPQWVRKALKRQPADTLYVFADQALGPWVPLVKHLPHVVHVHDLLALRSALGDIPENPTSITGKLYQRYIRHGFQQAKHFISISNKTLDDLHRFSKASKNSSIVVYNGLNYPYAPMSSEQALACLIQADLPAAPDGMLLHLGGSQWYKNFAGVIGLYGEYVKLHCATYASEPLPLWCISPPPSELTKALIDALPKEGKVMFFQGLDNKTLCAAYSHARAFLFPSLAEGFGWPLIEAQACGCPVLTTNDAPMNEIAGPSAIYIPLLKTGDDMAQWAKQGAASLHELLRLTPERRASIVEKSIAWTTQFNADTAITAYLKMYEQALAGIGNTTKTTSQSSI
ncbi:MAG TPA: glycosyltransferase [Methylophilaceae bacterium]|jgi:glycosyltransferase involved in cell wall biosynthesis